MKKILLQAAAATALMGAAAPALAQSVPPATVAVVDLEKVTSQCTACKSANAALTSQVNALRARQKVLATPLEAEAKSLQAAVNALGGKAPDAALQARIQAFQAKQQAGAAGDQPPGAADSAQPRPISSSRLPPSWGRFTSRSCSGAGPI